MMIEGLKFSVQPFGFTQYVGFLHLDSTGRKAFASLVTVPFEPAAQREKQ